MRRVASLLVLLLALLGATSALAQEEDGEPVCPEGSTEVECQVDDDPDEDEDEDADPEPTPTPPGLADGDGVDEADFPKHVAGCKAGDERLTVRRVRYRKPGRTTGRGRRRVVRPGALVVDVAGQTCWRERGVALGRQRGATEPNGAIALEAVKSRGTDADGRLPRTRLSIPVDRGERAVVVAAAYFGAAVILRRRMPLR